MEVTLSDSDIQRMLQYKILNLPPPSFKTCVQPIELSVPKEKIQKVRIEDSFDHNSKEVKEYRMGKDIGQKVQLPRPMVAQLPRSNGSMFEDDLASLWWEFIE